MEDDERAAKIAAYVPLSVEHQRHIARFRKYVCRPMTDEEQRKQYAFTLFRGRQYELQRLLVRRQPVPSDPEPD